jgi:hypothetical protein
MEQISCFGALEDVSRLHIGYCNSREKKIPMFYVKKLHIDIAGTWNSLLIDDTQ